MSANAPMDHEEEISMLLPFYLRVHIKNLTREDKGVSQMATGVHLWDSSAWIRSNCISSIKVAVANSSDLKLVAWAYNILIGINEHLQGNCLVVETLRIYEV